MSKIRNANVLVLEALDREIIKFLKSIENMALVIVNQHNGTLKKRLSVRQAN